MFLIYKGAKFRILFNIFHNKRNIDKQINLLNILYFEVYEDRIQYTLLLLLYYEKENLHKQ